MPTIVGEDLKRPGNGVIRSIFEPLFRRLINTKPAKPGKPHGPPAAPLPMWTSQLMTTPPAYVLDHASGIQFDGNGCYNWYNNGGALSTGDTGACSMGQSTVANRPAVIAAGLNGYRTLRFDGVTDQIWDQQNANPIYGEMAKNTSKFWFAIVYKKMALDGGASDRRLFYTSEPSGADRFMIQCSTGTPNAFFTRAKRLDGEAGTGLTGTTHTTAWRMVLVKVDYANGDIFLYENGSLTISNLAMTSSGTTSDTYPADFTTIAAQNNGSLRCADVEIASIESGKHDITAAEIDKWFGWRAHMFGLSSLLDSGHAYKNAAPTATYISYVSSLCQCDGPNNGTTLVDVVGQNVVVQGGAKLSTATKKFGSASMVLDGSGDYAYMYHDTRLMIGRARAWCFELWIKPTSVAAERSIMGKVTGSGGQGWRLHISATAKLVFTMSNAIGGVWVTLTSTTSIHTTDWQHVGVCCNGQSAWLMVHGSCEALTSSMSGPKTDAGVGYPLIIGRGWEVESGKDFIGNIDSWRFSNKMCPYLPSNYTVPTAAFAES